MDRSDPYDITRSIAGLNPWEKASRHNWALVPQMSDVPYIATVVPEKGNGPVAGRLMLFAGLPAFRDYVLSRQVRDYGVCMSPLDLAHFEAVGLKSGSVELFSYEPGFVPLPPTSEQRAFFAPILYECYGLLMRMEEKPDLPLAYIEKKAMFARKEVLRASWREVIGLGTVESLADSRVREQALWLKEHLSFERWRVGCDFAQCEGAQGLYDLIDCFDFLVGNGFVPHVLVEYVPENDPQVYENAFGDALRRLANRYGVQTIRAWRFELIVRGGGSDVVWGMYFELFSRIGKTLDEYGCAEGLMGPGLRCDQTCDNLRAFLREARRRHVRLGAVSIACRPAAPAHEDGKDLLVRTADRYYLRNQVMLAREALEQEGFDPNLLVVGGWRDSLETSNIMNDSCYEAASIMQTVLSSLGLVQSLCYNDALDLSVDGGALSAFLSGRSGILNRDGIPKPSYYAFDFLAHIGSGLVFCDERCMASANDADNYQIVCHNCERLNAAYLTTPEKQLDYQQMNSYFDEPSERTLRFELRNMRPGTYLVKTRFVNDAGGSVGNEALRMRLWCMDEPSRSEVEHLKAYAQPQLVLERYVVSDGTLAFERTLQSNEIAYLHVIYLY